MLPKTKSFYSWLEISKARKDSMTSKRIKFPDDYNFYYCRHVAFRMLSEIKDVASFFKNCGIAFKENCAGYLYLIELIWIGLINEAERLLTNRQTNELITWGEKDFSDTAIADLADSDRSFNAIYELNTKRKDITRLRLKVQDTPPNFSLINKLLVDLDRSIDKIDALIEEQYDIKRVNRDDRAESLFLMSHFLNVYNYIESYPIGAEADVDEIDWPRLPFSYLLTSNAIKNYDPRSPQLSNQVSAYFHGYKISVLFLYYKTDREAFNYVKTRILHSNTWRAFHLAGIDLFDNKIRNQHSTFISLFSAKGLKKEESALIPAVFENSSQLDLLFRGRELRVFSHSSDSDYVRGRVAIQHLLLGAVYLYDMGYRAKPELIELAEIEGDDSSIIYSYALYVPVMGYIWSASYWAVFLKLDAVSERKRSGEFRKVLEALVSSLKTKVKLTRVTVSDNCFKQYLAENEKSIMLNKHLLDQLAEAKGMATELLAGIYLQTKYLAKLKEFRKVDESTDVDVVGETSDSIIICQAKSTLPKPEQILKHFRNLEKPFKGAMKPKFLLFIMVPKDDDDNKQTYLKKRLNSESIEIAWRDDLEDQLRKSNKAAMVPTIRVIYGDRTIE